MNLNELKEQEKKYYKGEEEIYYKEILKKIYSIIIEEHIQEIKMNTKDRYFFEDEIKKIKNEENNEER